MQKHYNIFKLDFEHYLYYAKHSDFYTGNISLLYVMANANAMSQCFTLCSKQSYDTLRR